MSAGQPAEKSTKSPDSPGPKGSLLKRSSGVLLLVHTGLLVVVCWVLFTWILDVSLTNVLSNVVTTTGAEWVMYVLIALSVVSGGVMIERWLYYKKRRVDAATLRDRLDELLRNSDLVAARALMADVPGMEGTVTRACLDNMGQGEAAMEEAMRAALAHERLAYDHNLVVLGTLGNNAPFIGLFGTVLGIIKAFVDLSGDMQGGAAIVMAGVSEALVATGVGLLVAIPCVIAFNALKERVKGIVTGTETLARTVMQHARARQQGENDGV